MKKLLLLLLALPVFTTAQTINTVYGPDHTLSCGGWGSSITVDHSGNYYITDECNECVYKLTSAGVLTRIAGNGSVGYSGDGGPAINAALYHPMGVAVDAVGNVYIADMNNERVRKINISGIISTVAGIGSSSPGVGGFSGDGGPATAAQLNQPAGVFIDIAGNLFIADANNGRIRKVNYAGIISTVAGGGTAGLGDGGLATSAHLTEPINVTFDIWGNMYICEAYGGNRVRKVDITGHISTVAGTGIPGYNGDGILGSLADLNVPRCVAVSTNGTVYIADYNEARVRIVNPGTHIISTIAGNGTHAFSGDGGPSASAAINPGSITLDNSGDLIIADFGNERVRKVNTSVLGVAGTQATEATTLYPNPAGNVLTIAAATPINHIVITDVLGRTIASYDHNKNEVEVDVSRLVAGIYFVRINDLKVRQFVKE
jgi:hypothetical protein